MKDDYMLSDIPQSKIEEVCNNYQLLKKDSEYKFYYKLFSEFSSLSEQAQSTDKFSPLAKDLNEIAYSLERKINTDWKLTYPISPNYRITKKDLTRRTHNETSSLVRILYSFGIKIPFFLEYSIKAPARGMFELAFYPSGKPKNITVSKETLLRTKKHIKFLIYTLNKTGVQYRHLGLIFNLNKDTVKAWADEAQAWPEHERTAIQLELATSKRYTDKDVHDLPYEKRVSYNDSLKYEPSEASSEDEL